MPGVGGLRHDGDEANFVIIPRPTVRDEQLSLRALGLLTRLVDLPEGWEVNAKRLERMVKEGREAIYAALRELRAAGYYRVERRKGEGGRWVSGTAVAKVARPEWAAEYAEQEAARLAGKPEPVPTWSPAPDDPGTDQPPDTEGDDPTTPTGVREPVDREAGDREAVDREPRPLTEEPLRRSEYGSGEVEELRNVSRGPGGETPPDDPEPPARCAGAHPPGQACGACRDARIAHDAWEDRTRTRRRQTEDAERRRARELRDLSDEELRRCRLCNDRGMSLADGRVRCTHDPSSTTGHGRAEFDAWREQRWGTPQPA